VRKRGLERTVRSGSRRKVAYFAGCTARHLFPEVPKAAVEVLLRNGIGVTYPEQHCCGMPSMLEGDRDLTLRFAGRTIDLMADVVANGYDIVCSCPTCGYMLKQVLCEKAYFSDAYQARVGANDGSIQVPANIAITGARHDGRTSALKAENAKDATGVAGASFCRFDRAIYGNLLKDDGYFSGIDPLKRIQVAEHTYDLGEYLMGLFLSGEWVAPTGPVPGQMVYYPPCHQREQGIGSPYLDLLAMIPGASIQSFESSLYCCGIAGIMGFKKDFHEVSIQMGHRLTERIDQLAPDRLITDCLSCRLQFNQMTAYPVHHPVEILLGCYASSHCLE
jgi:glycerol-3-phosphate dehydrogenase subunit C